jgi:hypothetical protein
VYDSASEEVPPGDNLNDGPPFLRTWPRVYAAVLIALALLILILAVLTEAFAA